MAFFKNFCCDFVDLISTKKTHKFDIFQFYSEKVMKSLKKIFDLFRLILFDLILNKKPFRPKIVI